MQKHKPHTTQPKNFSETESAEELTDQRTFSILPAQLIQPDEVIILMLKPSLWFIPLTCLGSIAFTLVLALAIIYTDLDLRQYINLGKRDTLLILLAFIFTRLFWRTLDWLSRYYILTDKRVIRVKGITNIQTFETPLKNIIHTQTYATVTQQILGIGTIGFSTAAIANVDAYWLMINQPFKIHQIILQALNRYRK